MKLCRSFKLEKSLIDLDQVPGISCWQLSKLFSKNSFSKLMASLIQSSKFMKACPFSHNLVQTE